MADGYPLLAAAPVLGLAVDFAAHTLAARVFSRPAPAILTGIALGFAATAVTTVAGLLQRDAAFLDAAALAVFNAVGFLALAYGYFNFVNLNMTSLRIRLLHEFLETDRGLSRSEVLGRYDARELIERRIARLTEQKHAEERDGRFYLRPTVLLPIASTLDLLKWIVLRRKNRILARAESQVRTNQSAASASEPQM